MTPAILFVTGASGCGKTAVASALSASDPEGVYLHFDSIGVPSPATIIQEFGSGERWQEATTHRWIARIVAEHPTRPLVVLEGQVRPSFAEDAFAAHRVLRSAIVLVHCDDEEREARLAKRGQPELANATMRSWAAYLRHEARARRLPIVDSTKMSIAEVASAVVDVARRLLPLERPT